MQLSFLYATIFFAAAWASPVPDSANQAVTTQPLSKRAVKYYHEDNLQATSYSITNWLQSKHIEYYRTGGFGGDEFTDLNTLESFDVAPTITQVVILTGERINHIKLSGFFGVPSVPYDAPHGHDAQSLTNPVNTMDVHLDLAEGEWLTFVSVNGDAAGSYRKLTHMRFETNLKNKIEAGTLAGGLDALTRNFTAPEGFSRIVGFFGSDSDCINTIAPIWA